MICILVFHFARLLAAMTIPSFIAINRSPVTANSRLRIITAIHALAPSYDHSIAEKNKTLSFHFNIKKPSAKKYPRLGESWLL